MKRTLLAVGVAILASMMWIPASTYDPQWGTRYCRASIFEINQYRIDMPAMILQTTFVAVAAAVIVNLFPRRRRK